MIPLSEDEDRPFNPFGRDMIIDWLTEKDAEFLSKPPTTLKILIPIKIEEP